MSLLQSKSVYKPFEYPWAHDAWLMQQRIHWLPEEVPLADDVKDWKQKLTAEERNLLTQIFRFFTQSDVEVNNCYMKHYARVFQPTEVQMMLAAFSNMETVHIAAYSHLLDTIGMLNQVYRWGQIAWVGGGFGRSVHNLLEPAAYGLPVLFGPNHAKFPEAAGLIQAGGGFEVRNANELKPIMNRLNEDAYRQTAGDSARKWLDDHAGATATILAECRHILGE